jgi:hypothetical protein
MRVQLQERLKRDGVKTHKERVEELNKYLSRLSEHHDMYASLTLIVCYLSAELLINHEQAEDWSRLRAEGPRMDFWNLASKTASASFFRCQLSIALCTYPSGELGNKSLPE